MCRRRTIAGSRAIHRPSNVLALTKETGDESPYYYRSGCGVSRPCFAAKKALVASHRQFSVDVRNLVENSVENPPAGGSSDDHEPFHGLDKVRDKVRDRFLDEVCCDASCPSFAAKSAKKRSALITRNREEEQEAERAGRVAARRGPQAVREVAKCRIETKLDRPPPGLDTSRSFGTTRPTTATPLGCGRRPLCVNPTCTRCPTTT